MPSRRSSFPLSRLVIIACSLLHIVLAVLYVYNRLEMMHLSIWLWLLPSLMIGAGIAGVIVQSPAAPPALRPLTAALNILLIALTACCTLTAMSIIPFQDMRQPFVLVLLTLISIVPAWLILIALSFLSGAHGEGQLH